MTTTTEQKPTVFNITTARKSRQFVTRETCLAWLNRAKKESDEQSFFTPSEWLDSPGRNVMPTVAINMGLIKRIYVERNGELLPACKQWVDPELSPSIEMSEQLLVAYTKYRRDHGTKPKKPTITVQPDEKSLAAKVALDKIGAVQAPLELDMAHAIPQTQLDRIEHNLLDLHLKLDRFEQFIAEWS